MRRFWVSCQLICKGHILNPLWLSSEKRRAIRSKVFSDVITRYLTRCYLPAVKGMKDDGVRQDEPERVFSIWLQGEENAPELVKNCFRSIRQHSGLELVVLDVNTLPDWISLPEKIWEKYRSGKIKPAHFSDICRVELLHSHGGWWMDATVLMTAGIPENIADTDFFVYHSGSTISGYYSFIQNCFIHARKGSYLLETWRAMILDFWMKEDKRIDYFQHQLMFRTIILGDPHAAELFAAVPDITHDASHRLWLRDGDLPYSPEAWNEATGGSFWQKTTYRKTDSIIPGSLKDHAIHCHE